MGIKEIHNQQWYEGFDNIMLQSLYTSGLFREPDLKNILAVIRKRKLNKLNEKKCNNK
jgi:hypothetical protein